MRISRSSHCLLILVCVTTGCSQTGGVRPYNSSNTRTVASVGDKPLPIVTGEPGSSLLRVDRGVGSTSARRLAHFGPGLRREWKTRLERESTACRRESRRAARSTTRRPINRCIHVAGTGCANSSYTVIAEYQGEDGLMTGRVDAEAPRTNVNISLRPRDANSGQNRAAIRPAKPRVEPISNAEPGDDDEANGNSKPRIRNDKPPAARPGSRVAPSQIVKPSYGASVIRSFIAPSLRGLECAPAFHSERRADQHRRCARGAMMENPRPEPRCPMNPRRNSTMTARIRCRRRSRLTGSVPAPGRRGRRQSHQDGPRSFPIALSIKSKTSHRHVCSR